MAGDRNRGILTSKNDINELRRLVLEGWSDQQLADRFGCCLMTVYNRRRKYDIKRPKHIPPDIDADELRQLVDAGLSDLAIAQRLGISLSAEKYYIEKHGCQRPVRHHITKEEMKQLVETGMTDDEIACHYGFSPATIRSYRQRYGILRKNKNLLDKITREKLISLLNDGKSDEEIATMAGVNVRSIEQFRCSIGMFHTRRIDIPEHELRESIDNGMSDNEIGKKYGCSAYTVYTRMIEYGIMRDDSYSSPERKWKKKFEKLNLHEGTDFIHNDHSFLHDEEIDFLFPEHSLGIEINPSITHSSDSINYVPFAPKRTTYHQKKALLAEAHGINLISVYDWNDEEKTLDIIKSNLGMTRRVGARQCSIVVPSVAEERAFLSANHLQGYAVSDIRLGLSYDGRLVALMSFCNKRFNAPENAQYELLRYASSRGVTVTGGASRLFSHIVSDHAITSVISYASLDISNGDLYDRLGFHQTRITKPSYMWVDPRNPKRHYSWNLIRSKGVDNILGTDIGKGSNVDIML